LNCEFEKKQKEWEKMKPLVIALNTTVKPLTVRTVRKPLIIHIIRSVESKRKAETSIIIRKIKILKNVTDLFIRTVRIINRGFSFSLFFV
jgi:hypothetical protein